MEEINYNKYNNMPLEDALNNLKVQKQRLSELKEKQRYLVENDPNNEQLKNEFNKEWKAILGEISDIYALNENMNRINESSNNKASNKDKNMGMGADSYSYERDLADNPTIDDIKGFLTDYNSESNSEGESSYKRRVLRNQRKKNIQDRYFEVLSRNLQNMNVKDNYNNSPRMMNQKDDRMRYDDLDFMKKSGRFLEDYDETGKRLVNNRISKKSSIDNMDSLNDISDRSGPIIDEEMLKDLNDIKELNKAIQRSNLIDDYDELEMLKNRRMPPPPSNSGVVNPINSSPMNYEFIEKLPSNSAYMMDNFEGSSDHGFNPARTPLPSSPMSMNMNLKHHNRTKRHVDPAPMDELDDYIDVNALRSGGSNSGMINKRNKNPMLGFDMPPMPSSMLDTNYMDNRSDRVYSSPSLMSKHSITNSPNLMSGGLPSPMARPTMGTPTMQTAMNPMMNNMAPTMPNMNGMGGMSSRLNAGMGPGMGMMSNEAAMEWNQLEEELNEEDGEDELDSDIDDLFDNPKSKEYKGNKALKLLGVGAKSGAINRNKGRNPYAVKHQNISVVPKQNYIPMSGIGMGKSPYMMNESRSLDNIASLNNMNSPYSPDKSTNLTSFMSAPDKLNNLGGMNMNMNMNMNMGMGMGMNMGNGSGSVNNEGKAIKVLGIKNKKPSAINTNPMMSMDYGSGVNASFMINNNMKGFANGNSPGDLISPINKVGYEHIPVHGVGNPLSAGNNKSPFNPRSRNNFNQNENVAKRYNDPHNKSFGYDESMMSMNSNNSGGHRRSNSNSNNNNNSNNSINNNNNSNSSIDRFDFSRPRDPKNMRPEDKLDAIILPSLTVTMKQITIHELTTSTSKNILTSGYLLKRSSSLFKKWKHRYFILCSDHLYCFASNQPNEKSLLAIPITKDAVVRAHTEENKYIIIFIAVWYEFSIVQKEFYFQAINEEEMNLWVKQIKMAITVEKFKRTSLPKVPELPMSLLENLKNANTSGNTSGNISSFESYKMSNSHPNMNSLSEEATYRNSNSNDYELSIESNGNNQRNSNSNRISNGTAGNGNSLNRQKEHLSISTTNSINNPENTSLASIPSTQAKIFSNNNKYEEHRNSGLHQRINDIKMESKHDSMNSNSNLSISSSKNSFTNDTNATLKNNSPIVTPKSAEPKKEKIEYPARISSNNHKNRHKRPYKSKHDMEKYLRRKEHSSKNKRVSTENILKHLSLDDTNVNTSSSTDNNDLRFYNKDLDFSDEEDLSILMDEDFMNKSKMAENSFYIHSGDEKSFNNSIDYSISGKNNKTSDLNLNYNKVIITEISRKDSDGAERFVRPRKHHRSRSEGSNLKSFSSISSSSKKESHRHSFNSGVSDEETNLSMYQEILSSNKTNYRISHGNLTMKSNDDDNDMDDNKNRKINNNKKKDDDDYSKSEDDDDDEEEAFRRMENLKNNKPSQNFDADKKISISKSFSSFMNEFDEKIKNNETDESIENDSTIKDETNNINNSTTPTEEYFNKALTELAALSSLSKK
ncbi:hypothetical protein BCR32DRAFT_298103 [Anaeromyces robustus]|uniref:PH domain-containing protein n=1 Tax=Anaeromyces robustus TaxID=1754192 RepID=A0A1Y1VUE2_9FUNG|nr:hypothetical protein BCR32DRAFT_298103 [Anaeromyces robustus]|eukprot:ORX64364.1 hypothetical protein BCR32DRAFT_298103 [Anaeromyces robustus]